MKDVCTQIKPPIYSARWRVPHTYTHTHTYIKYSVSMINMLKCFYRISEVCDDE